MPFIQKEYDLWTTCIVDQKWGTKAQFGGSFIKHQKIIHQLMPSNNNWSFCRRPSWCCPSINKYQTCYIFLYINHYIGFMYSPLHTHLKQKINSWCRIFNASWVKTCFKWCHWFHFLSFLSEAFLKKLRIKGS